MPFQAVPDCTLVELIYMWNTQRVENTLWVRHPTPPNITELNSLADAVIAWWVAQVRPSISNDLALIQVDATYKGDPTGPQAQRVTGLPSTGAVPTNSTTNGTAFVIKFGTANIGRSFRGRNYIPGLPADAYVDSFLTTNPANDLLSAYSGLTLVFQGNGVDHVVVSRNTGGLPRPVGISTPVNSYTATTLASRSQRRRNPGIGA